MSKKQNDSMRRWVSAGMCLTACLAVLGLLYIESTGVSVNTGAYAVVGVFVLNASGYAFYGQSSTELILEFLKNFKN